VLLAPTINLMRTPLGWPRLRVLLRGPGADRPARGGVRARVQSAGVAATVKHFVGNDSETQRWTYDARIASRCSASCTWRRSRPACGRAGVALVMAAYNKVNGVPMTEHARLLRDVLKDEWGLRRRGHVTTAHAAAAPRPPAMAGSHLARQGPDGHLGCAQAGAGGRRRRGHPEVLERQGGTAAQAGRPGSARVLPGGDDPPGPPRAPSARADLRPAVADGAGFAASQIAVPSTVSALGGSSPRGDTAFVDPVLLRRATAASLVAAAQRARRASRRSRRREPGGRDRPERGPPGHPRRRPARSSRR